MEKRILVLSLAAAGLILSGSSQAAVSKQLEVMATVASSCTLDVSKVDFGIFSGTELTANGEVRVNCNQNVPYVIGLDGGRNIDAAGNRTLQDGAGNALPYRLTYLGEPWGDNGSTDPNAARPVLGVGKGAIERFTVEGFLWVPATAPAPGVYSDIVTVTVSF